MSFVVKAKKRKKNLNLEAWHVRKNVESENFHAPAIIHIKRSKIDCK